MYETRNFNFGYKYSFFKSCNRLKKFASYEQTKLIKQLKLKIMHSLEGILIPATIFGIIAYILKAWMDHREKMRLISKGVDMPKYEPTRSFFSWLKLAGLLIGLAIGILIGNLLGETTILDEEVAYSSMVLLFGGISVFVTHVLEKKGTF